MLIRSRRCLTLIEVMVVIAIIALIAGIIGYNVSKGIRDQRFRSEVSIVLDKLRLAQNLMVILNEDVEVHFQKVAGGIDCALTFQCPLDKGWDRELTRKTRLLTGIRDVEFKGEGEKKEAGRLILRFCSSGLVMSRGVLTLYKDENVENARYICLRGYPFPLSALDREEGHFCLADQANALVSNLTQFIVPEVEAKLQVLKNLQNIEAASSVDASKDSGKQDPQVNNDAK